MFRHVNDNNYLVLMWDKHKQDWGFLTETQLISNFRYCDLWQLKYLDEEIYDSVIKFKYKRIIKTFGKAYREYAFLKRQEKLMFT